MPREVSNKGPEPHSNCCQCLQQCDVDWKILNRLEETLCKVGSVCVEGFSGFNMLNYHRIWRGDLKKGDIGLSEYWGQLEVSS
jgi:hypothetical protein